MNKPKYAFVIGNILRNAVLNQKIAEKIRDGYRIFSNKMIPTDNVHPGMVALSFELVEIDLPQSMWVARYAKRTKTN